MICIRSVIAFGFFVMPLHVLQAQTPEGLDIINRIDPFAASQAGTTPEQSPPSSDTDLKTYRVSLSAAFEAEGAPIARGLEWRVFRASSELRRAQGIDEKPVAQSDEASPTFSLPAGAYQVEISYGFAVQRVTLNVMGAPLAQTFIIPAGGLRITGAAGEDSVPDTQIRYSITATEVSGDVQVEEDNMIGGELYRLPSGLYTIVGRYGSVNAYMQADLRVETGKITNAVLHFNAATVTLKLVNDSGGEALANTSWTILTPGGDVVFEADGAFPSVTLAEGEYSVIARHDQKLYNRMFAIVPGINHDLEVIIGKQ